MQPQKSRTWSFTKQAIRVMDLASLDPIAPDPLVPNSPQVRRHLLRTTHTMRDSRTHSLTHSHTPTHTPPRCHVHPRHVYSVSPPGYLLDAELRPRRAAARNAHRQRRRVVSALLRQELGGDEDAFGTEKTDCIVDIRECDISVSGGRFGMGKRLKMWGSVLISYARTIACVSSAITEILNANAFLDVILVYRSIDDRCTCTS